MASSSTIITCIQSALDDLAGVMKPLVPSGVRVLRFQLRNLKTFVVCSRKLVNDESQLGSLLLWIEDVVCVKAREISDDANYSLEMESLEEEIQDWYITMLDPSSSSDLMSTDQLLELMSSILESLVEIYDLRSSNLHFEMLGEAMEGLREQIAFLKCLVQIGDPETSGDLMIHAKDVAINAAYLIFTCGAYEKRKGITFNISCLVQKIKPIDPWVCETYTQVLRSRPAPTQGMKSLLNSLISNLWEILLQLNTPHLAPVELHLKELYEGLRSLRTVVAAQPEPIEEDIGAVVCDAGVLICSLYQSHTDLPLQNLLESINTILMGLKSYGDEPTVVSFLQAMEVSRGDFLGENSESCNEREDLGEVEVLSPTTPPTITNEMVGHHDDIRSVCDRLYRGSKYLGIISIVGMLGIGKTTLALHVFNDAEISHHFSCQAWCHVSQLLDKRRVLIQLLNQLTPWKHYEETETEEYLERMLRQCLKGCRYLIFLDDVWSTQVWESLKCSFPDDGVGSRIILTSRFHDVAPDNMLVDRQPYIVRELSREESLELLHRKLFPEQHDWPPEFRDLAMPFVEICGGLPLTVVIIAGHLASVKAEGWKATLVWLKSGNMLTKRHLSTFDLSYEHLPDYLKSCFLYFATFPKDEVSVWRLLRLWIAEGFVHKDLMKTPEDIAESYLYELNNRSLIKITKRRSDSGVKACRVDDRIHDYCTQKAREEKFSHFLKGSEELSAFNEQPGLWRLRIESRPEHFKESKLFCPRAGSLLFRNSSQQTERAVEEEDLFLDISFLIPSQQTERVEEEDLFLDISFLIRTFKFLHVLDIEQINVGHVFPSELEVLVQLAFVAIRGEMRQIPSSITKLSKLETLIVDAGIELVALPDTLGNLSNLQFLYVRSSRSSGGATLPATILENSCVLHGLGTICGVVVPSWSIMGRLMRKFPNTRKLKCRRAMDDTRNIDKSVALDFLSQLHSLHLSSLNSCQFKLRLPENLKKLTLSGFHLVPKKMSAIGMLPNLKVLKLLHVSFEGNTWEMVGQEFMILRVLKLHSPSLVRWTDSSDGESLSCLVKLILDGCKSLQEIPSASLEFCPAIEVIEVYGCSDIVVSSVREIEEVHQDLGNEVKIIFSDD